MSYRLTPIGKAYLPLPGVRWGDMSDREFADAKRKHPGIEAQGYFAKVEEEPVKAQEPPKQEAAVKPAKEEPTDG